MLDGYRAEGSVGVRGARAGPGARRVVRRAGSSGSAIRWPTATTSIFQMPFVHDGIRGIADFLVRTVDPDTGAVTYEPVDAKLARNEAKPGHVLQLCFYAEAIARAHRRSARARAHRARLRCRSRRSGSTTCCRTGVACAASSAELVDAPPTDDTFPEPCDHCQFCQFEMVCEDQWRAADSLVHVAGVRAADRVTLRGGPASTRSPAWPRSTGRSTASTTAAATGSSARPRCRSRPASTPTIRRRSSWLPTPTGRAQRGVGDRGRSGSRRCPRPTTATCSSTSRVTRSGVPTSACSSCSAGSSADASRRVGVQGAVGARPGGGGGGHQAARRLPRRPPPAVPEHARVPLQPHRALVAAAADERARRGRTRAGAADRDGDVRRPVSESSRRRCRSAPRATASSRSSGWPATSAATRSTGVPARSSSTSAGWPTATPTISRRSPPTTRTTSGRPGRCATGSSNSARRRCRGVRRCSTSTSRDPELDARIEALHAFGPGTDEHLMGDLLGYWRRENSAVAADGAAPVDGARRRPDGVDGCDRPAEVRRAASRSTAPRRARS